MIGLDICNEDNHESSVESSHVNVSRAIECDPTDAEEWKAKDWVSTGLWADLV